MVKRREEEDPYPTVFCGSIVPWRCRTHTRMSESEDTMQLWENVKRLPYPPVLERVGIGAGFYD